ncbi:MAG: NAD(P)-binding protein [Proteobacteria bacterium]|nr:NAD(P)-binding protein [Pseudomonadota bacterium]
MKLRLHGLNIDYDQDPQTELARIVSGKFGKYASKIDSFSVVRRSVDARKRPVKLSYSVDVVLRDGQEVPIPGATEPKTPVPLRVQPGGSPLSLPPVIVGGGPAGLFAAYLLAEHGYSPVLLERGGDVRKRIGKLHLFDSERTPDPECNALFGLGGAGTFSDGKLTTGINHPWLPRVLEVLVECGAPEKILIEAKPHVGTDILRNVIENLVKRIRKAGGTITTGYRVEKILSKHGRLSAVQGPADTIETELAVFAIGHSARDTWSMLASHGIALAPKPFQMGIRVEHPQRWLDDVRYGEAAGHPALGAADYKLAIRVNDTPVFSFCMCPGGMTMPTVNEPEHLAINGMSRSARDSQFASSGIVVTLKPDLYGGTDLDSCLAFQRRVERICFEAGGSDYRAPGQRLVDFADGRESPLPLPPSSYRLGVESVRLDEILPPQVANPIRGALAHFNKRIDGYLHPQALALAPESRASSPIRIVRDPTTLESPSLEGLYPVGEGAGYAGGIMSSALDGMNAARKIIEAFARPQQS